jgi:hypothetical protein
MRTPGFLRGRILLLWLFMGSHLPLFGCTDNSRTSGTMVEVSDEFKAHTKSKLEKYQGGPPKKELKSTSKKF